MSEHARLVIVGENALASDISELEDALDKGFEVAQITVAGTTVHYLLVKPKGEE